MPVIRLSADFHKQNSIFEAAKGTRLIDFLRREDIPAESPCGGNGTCGKCLVFVDGHVEKACSYTIQDDCTIGPLPGGTAASDASEGKGLIEESSSTSLTPSASVQPRPGIGAAVDLGTTTVVVSLYNLTDGHCLGTVSDWNCQSPYGGDVISRVQYCMERPRGLAQLGRSIRRQIRLMIQQIIDDLGGDESLPFPLTEVVVAGNTIMEHIFAGIDPAPIARAPYLPTTLFAEDTALKFPEFGSCSVRLLPCIAGYVGGDITAGLLACRLKEDAPTTLFLDIGTNGEMALVHNGSITCCSAATGPAFEGAQISCGMRSTVGAINHVALQSDPRGRAQIKCEVIGGADVPPAGFCGSALIDLLALLLREGVVDESGRLLGPEEGPPYMQSFLTEDENENGIFWPLPGRMLKVTAADIRQLQLAKAAVAAGIQSMLKANALLPADIARVLIAGGFGRHLDPENTCRIGMLPLELSGCTEALGNTSLTGAAMLLLDPSLHERLTLLIGRCHYMELSTDPTFAAEYIEQMLFCAPASED